MCFTSLLPCFKDKVKGRGQGQRSGSRVKAKSQGQISGTQQSILGARLCRLQQRAIEVMSSLRCLSVCQWAYADNCSDAVDRRFNGFILFSPPSTWCNGNKGNQTGDYKQTIQEKMEKLKKIRNKQMTELKTVTNKWSKSNNKKIKSLKWTWQTILLNTMCHTAWTVWNFCSVVQWNGITAE